MYGDTVDVRRRNASPALDGQLLNAGLCSNIDRRRVAVLLFIRWVREVALAQEAEQRLQVHQCCVDRLCSASSCMNEAAEKSSQEGDMQSEACIKFESPWCCMALKQSCCLALSQSTAHNRDIMSSKPA